MASLSALVEFSVVNKSNVTDSVINNSWINHSVVNNSNLFDVNLSSSIVHNSNLTNVTIISSTIRDMVLNNTVITDDQCSSGTIVYGGTTYNCPIALSTIYNPPAPNTGGGGGGGDQLQDCRDGKDNDDDGLIDYPSDPGCVSSYDIDESEETCTESWSCVTWSNCIGGVQSRTCSDANNCENRLATGGVESIIRTIKPAEEKGCGPDESCTDGILNQGESAVDCGGPCNACPSDEEVLTCSKVADCPEGFSCVDNNCVEIPVREPSGPEFSLTEVMGNIFEKGKFSLGALMDFNEIFNKRLVDLLKILFRDGGEFFGEAFDFYMDLSRGFRELIKDFGIWGGGLAKEYSLIGVDLLGEAFDLYMDLTAEFNEFVNDMLGKGIEFTKNQYGSTLIVILVIALLVAGYFAIRTFKGSEHYVKSKEKREEKKEIAVKEEAQETGQELSYFIRDSLFAGHPTNMVKKSLVEQGWPKKVVDEYTKRVKEKHGGELKTAKKIRKLSKEEKKIESGIKKPEKGIKFAEKPEFTRKKIKIGPIVLKTKPVKPTQEIKRIDEELAELEKEIKRPRKDIKFKERPKFVKKVVEVGPIKLKGKTKPSRGSKWTNQEMKELELEVKEPSKGIKYNERPKILKKLLPSKPILFKSKVKPSKDSKILSEELIALEKEIVNPTVKRIEKPEVQKKPKKRITKSERQKVDEKISKWIRENWSKEEIIEELKKEDWPEDVIKIHLKESFPQLESLSRLKKEVTELEEALNKLKR